MNKDFIQAYAKHVTRKDCLLVELKIDGCFVDIEIILKHSNNIINTTFRDLFFFWRNHYKHNGYSDDFIHSLLNLESEDGLESFDIECESDTQLSIKYTYTNENGDLRKHTQFFTYQFVIEEGLKNA